MNDQGEPESLSDILAKLREASEGETVSVRDILEHIGTRSFAPLLLVPALILVSPISGIPGTPTIGSIVILLIAGQAVFGRRSLWLPGFVMRRRIKSSRFRKALAAMEKPIAFIDRHSHKRLTLLTMRPFSFVAIGVCLAIAAILPFLELLPMVTSIWAFAISLLALGLMVRDGVIVIAGYAVVAANAALILRLIS